MTWPVNLHLHGQAYPLGAIQRAVYSLAKDLVIEVQPQGEQITLVAMPRVDPAITTPISVELARELLLQQLNDFVLRERISRETAGLRELLVRAALADCRS
ncbi:TPA: His-Xaa-Ser system protein HxsD [Pseudomonas aeruginosa]